MNTQTNQKIKGLHHVTAITSGAQKNVDFYAGILGMRFIKKTVNFDSPDVYHLYFGDTLGTPGTAMTFFVYRGILNGRKGKGQVTTTSFSVASQSLAYWQRRLEYFGVAYSEPRKRFDDELYIYFEDYDGLGIELIATDQDNRNGFDRGPVPVKHAIKGFYGVTLTESTVEYTAELLTDQLNHTLICEQDGRYRFAPDDKPGALVDIVVDPNSLRAFGGSGTVHHIAFATPGDAEQLDIREKLIQSGVQVTPIINRQYFNSIYFREPGGALFEVATNGPGFMVDERPEQLGSSLMLPPWEESRRDEIVKGLEPIDFNPEKFKDHAPIHNH